jgi:uncharacterized protein YodC (DUF2158 family)
MKQLKPGDRVRQSPEGPAMTVVQINDGFAVCQWIDAEGRIEHKSFLAADLEPADDEPLPNGDED